MKVGIAMAFSHHTSVEFIRAAVQFAENKGVHSIWVPEHVMFFPDYASTYPYSRSGRIPGDPEGILDPFTALTYIASCTQTVRLGTGVCLVPQRQPVYTAKMVADVDFLSGGRVDFGVGVGWLEEEFNNLGADFANRGKLCEEYIDAMKELWSDGVSTFKGPTIEMTACHFNPKPVQKPHPPIYFGGESKAALKRVAQQGDGWYGYDMAPSDLARRIQALDSALADAGRRREDITLIVGPNRHPVTPETTAAYRDLGVDQLVVPVFGSSLEKFEVRLDALLEAAVG